MNIFKHNLKVLKFKNRDVYYNVVHRFLVYLEFKGIINNDKHNQVNNNSDIEYIKNVMESIVSHYE